MFYRGDGDGSIVLDSTGNGYNGYNINGDSRRSPSLFTTNSPYSFYGAQGAKPIAGDYADLFDYFFCDNDNEFTMTFCYDPDNGGAFAGKTYYIFDHPNFQFYIHFTANYVHSVIFKIRGVETILKTGLTKSGTGYVVVFSYINNIAKAHHDGEFYNCSIGTNSKNDTTLRMRFGYNFKGTFGEFNCYDFGFTDNEINDYLNDTPFDSRVIK